MNKKALVFGIVMLVIAFILIIPMQLNKKESEVKEETEEIEEPENPVDETEGATIVQGKVEAGASADTPSEGSEEPAHEHKEQVQIEIDQVPEEVLEAVHLTQEEMRDYVQSFVNGYGYYGVCSYGTFLGWEKDIFNKERVYCYFQIDSEDEASCTVEYYEDEIFVTKGIDKNK